MIAPPALALPPPRKPRLPEWIKATLSADPTQAMEVDDVCQGQYVTVVVIALHEVYLEIKEEPRLLSGQIAKIENSGGERLYWLRCPFVGGTIVLLRSRITRMLLHPKPIKPPTVGVA